MSAASDPGRRILGELVRVFSLATSATGADLQTEVHGVSLDHRLTEAGELFAALPGARTHGARFAREAVRSGAAAVLTDRAGRDMLAADADADADADAGAG